MKKATVRIVQRKRLADKANGVADKIYRQRIKLLPVFVMLASLAALIYLRVQPESSKQVSRLIESSFSQISRLSFLWSPVAALIAISVGALLYMWMDYQHHKKPLIQVAPKTKYGMLHHIRVVMLPRFHYRWRPAFYWLAVAEVCAAAFIATVALVGVPAASAFSGDGLGTEVSPYIITSCEQLQEMRDDRDGYYELGQSINCTGTSTWNSGAGFEGIGYGDSGMQFTGTLDGKGFAIDGLYQHVTAQNTPPSLLGVTLGATVKNLRLTNVDISSVETEAFLAPVVLQAVNSTFTDISVTGAVSASGTTEKALTSGFAGIVAMSTVERVAVDVVITNNTIDLSNGDSGKASWAAGLAIISNISTITDSYTTGSITGSFDDGDTTLFMGGLLGQAMGGSVQRTYSDMSLSLTRDPELEATTTIVGNLIAIAAGAEINHSFSIGEQTVSVGPMNEDFRGGLVAAVIFDDGGDPPFDTNIAGTQNYFDVSRAGAANCIGGYTTSNTHEVMPDQTPVGFCASVNVGNAQPTYFVNNSTNAPFTVASSPVWDFTNIWKTQASGLPIFTWQSPQVPSLPGQVRNLTTNSTEATSLTAQWLAPLSNGNSAITNYAVEYKLHSAGSWTSVTRSPSTTTSQPIAGLAAGQLYDIRVAAINGVGQGDWRVTENVSTNQLPSVPREFEITGVQAADEFEDFYFPELNWQVPETGGPITDYIIQYKVNPGPDWDAMEEDLENEGVPWVTGDWVTVTDGTNTNLSLNSLDNIDAYLTQAIILNAPLEAQAIESLVFRVAAVNAHGQGPWADSQNFRVFVGLTECQQMHDKLEEYPFTLFHLINDIDCSDTVTWNSGAGWVPVQTEGAPFTGTIDGQGHSISDLYIHDTRDDTAQAYEYATGLIDTAENATIRNLTLTDVSVESLMVSNVDHLTGSLVGRAKGSMSLSNLTVDGEVKGDDEKGVTGGIVGSLDPESVLSQVASLTNVSFDGAVEGTGYAGGIAGGLGSFNEVAEPITAHNLQTSGQLVGLGSGGIAGVALGLQLTGSGSSMTIDGEFSSGCFEGECTNAIGGLLGTAGSGSIEDSEYDGTIDCRSAVDNTAARYVGGLVGAGYGALQISGSTSAGQILYSNGSAGGLVGYGLQAVTIDPEDPEAVIDEGLVISDSSSSMDIDSQDGAIRLVGGLVGAATLLDINNSHATGSITVGDGDQAEYGVSGSAGGLVGQLSGGSNLVSALRIRNSHATGAIDFEAVSPVEDSMGGPALGGVVGMVVGWSKLENVHASGNVSMTLNAACQVDGCDWMQARAGGVAGYVSAPEALEVPVAINEAYATGEVSSDNRYASAMIGGAFGDVSVPVLQMQDTYATGRVITYQDDSAYSGSVAGGLAGSVAVLSTSTLQSLYATGNVSGSANYRIVGIRDFFWPESSGGLIGALQGPVSLQKSYATGNVEGGGAVGGLIGSAARLMYGEIEDDARSIQNTYATGNVTGFKDRSYFPEDSEFDEGYLEFGTRAGGLIGYAANTSVAKSYASGVLTNQRPEFAGESEAYWNYLYGASSGGLIGQVGFGLPNTPPDGQVVLSDSFSAVTMQDTTDNTKGALIGDFWWVREPGDGQSEVELNTLIQNTYYDIYRSGALSCSNEIAPVAGAQPEDITITTIALNDPSVCKSVNGSNQTPDYFKNNTTNPPLNTWDFSAPIWYSHVTIYPTFQPGETVPGPPRDLGGVPTTSSMALSWNPPLSDGGSPIINYRLQYRRNGTTDWIEYSHAQSTATAYTIPGLVSGARYDFQVSAINAVGQSTWTLGIYDVLVPGEPPVDPPVYPPDPPQPPRPDRPTGSNTPVSPVSTPVTEESEILDIAKLPENALPGLISLPERSLKTNPVPYFFLSWLLLLALYFAYRAWQEHRYQKAMLALIVRTKNTQQAVSSFIAITTHYLNTPLSILKGAIELIASKHGLQSEFVAQFQEKLQALGNTAVSLTAQNEQVLGATSPVVAGSVDLPESRKQLWIPLAVIAALIAITDIVLIFSKSYDHSWARLLNHVIWAVFGTVAVIVTYAAWRKQKQLHAQYRQELQREGDLLEQKRAFVGQAAMELEAHTKALRLGTEGLEKFPDTKLLTNGLAMLTNVTNALGKVQRFSAMNSALPNLQVKDIYQRDLASGLNKLALDKNVTITDQLQAGSAVQMQPEELHHLLQTTTENAIQFSNPQGSVVVASQAGRGKTALTVRDDGAGMTSEVQAHLFEPLTRGTDTATFDHQGLGLSLYITKMIVEKYGGHIAITSAPAHGTTVSMSIPVRHADPTGVGTQVIQPTTTTM